jgi:hypothetical protein
MGGRRLDLRDAEIIGARITINAVSVMGGVAVKSKPLRRRARAMSLS